MPRSFRQSMRAGDDGKEASVSFTSQRRLFSPLTLRYAVSGRSRARGACRRAAADHVAMPPHTARYMTIWRLLRHSASLADGLISGLRAAEPLESEVAPATVPIQHYNC